MIGRRIVTQTRDLSDVSPTAGTEGQVLVNRSGIWTPEAQSGGGIVVTVFPVEDEPASTKMLGLSDELTYRRCSNAGGIVITVPPESSVPWSNDIEIAFEQQTAGTVEIVEGSGVVVNCTAAYQKKTSEQYAVIWLKKVGTNVWILTGERMPL